MPELCWSQRAVSIGMVALVISLGILSFDRAQRGRYDFHHFYIDAKYVWTHGVLNEDLDAPDADDRRQLPFYLPFVALVLSPIAAFGRDGAAVIWALTQVSCFTISLTILRRWGRAESAAAPREGPIGVAMLLALPAFIEAARFNQLSFVVLALILGGMRCMEREHPLRGGALLGIAAALKLLPLIYLPWLVLKRRWNALAGFVFAGILFAALPPLLAWGPHETLRHHRQWWTYNVAGKAAGGMLDPTLDEHFIDRRNQSITHVIARWTWPQHPYALPVQPLSWDAPTCRRIALGISTILGALLLLGTRRSWSRLTDARRRSEFAVYAIGMLVFAPLLRQYYLVWAVPALVLLARQAADGMTPCERRRGWTGVAVWLIGMTAWVFPITREAGAHLFMLIVLGVLLLWRQPAAAIMPTDARHAAEA